MNNDQAFAVFETAPASASSERLRAARFLALHATPEQRRRLSRIRDVERNSWVRKALDYALKHSEPGGASKVLANVGDARETPVLDIHLQEELRAQAIEETSGLFLHELRPLVGFLEVAAAAEIGHYTSSRTKASVDRVRLFLDAIERLQEASAAPATQEFDLTDLVARVAADEAKHGRAVFDNSTEHIDENALRGETANRAPQQAYVRLSLARQDPVMTTGDPALVEMALANALRNAIEAALEDSEHDGDDVILNWGMTDTDSWIVVLDDGCGLPSGWDRLTKPGTSTKSKKEGHLGMGLSIARRAMESTHGSIEHTPRSGGGVSCAIRWPSGGLTE